MILRCSECKKEILKQTAYQEWLMLYNYFEIDYLNGDISEELYHRMIDILMSFKAFALEQDDG